MLKKIVNQFMFETEPNHLICMELGQIIGRTFQNHKKKSLPYFLQNEAAKKVSRKGQRWVICFIVFFKYKTQ